MPEVQILASDDGDWLGVYYKGKLVYEGHSISPATLLEVIEVSHDFQSVDFYGKNWSNCPEKWPEPERGM